jgi:hypothetical protein
MSSESKTPFYSTNSENLKLLAALAPRQFKIACLKAIGFRPAPFRVFCLSYNPRAFFPHWVFRGQVLQTFPKAAQNRFDPVRDRGSRNLLVRTI